MKELRLVCTVDEHRALILPQALNIDREIDKSYVYRNSKFLQSVLRINFSVSSIVIMNSPTCTRMHTTRIVLQFLAPEAQLSIHVQKKSLEKHTIL